MLHINENFLLLIGNNAMGPSFKKYCFDSFKFELWTTLHAYAISFLSSFINQNDINKDDKNLFLSKGYQLIGSRPGSKRELDLAKLTLNELILNRKNNEIGIDLSRELIKHLEILGYSNNSPNKVRKKYIV